MSAAFPRATGNYDLPAGWLRPSREQADHTGTHLSSSLTAVLAGRSLTSDLHVTIFRLKRLFHWPEGLIQGLDLF
ncbi:MAG: hypothetical protein KFF73_08730 [Cyclobacteriaceae bacterium]|nr:hypothetical protein [Cyclobacteriaceae bacterium]